MNIEILKLELVQRVTGHIQAGHFQNADELIEKALDALDGQAVAQPGEKSCDQRTGADFIAALQASPYRELDIEPARFRVEVPARDVTF